MEVSTFTIVATAIPGVVAAYFLYRQIFRPKPAKFQIPFVNDSRRERDAIETDREKRNLRMRRQFAPTEVPEGLDAIVIGSGIGGMSAAAILARTGRKVLVLEQHNKAGGCCHTFVKDDTEWDVGIHYVGKMGKNNFNRFVLDQITEGQLDWAPLEEEFDNIGIEDPKTKKLVMVPVRKNLDTLISSLVERYPDDEQAIRSFYKLLKEACELDDYLAFMKLAPRWLCRLMVAFSWLPFFGGLRRFFKLFNKTTVQDALEEYFPNNKQLRIILSYCWADTGSMPREAPLGLLASVFGHYKEGGYYPVGGSTEIPYSIIPTIERAGGRVLMKARVKEILLSEDKGTAYGVRVEYGKNKLVDIRAPLVISDAGVSNTFMRMLPREVADKTEIGRLLGSNRLRPSCVMVQVFVGLQGSQEDLQLPSKNYWIFYDCSADDLKKWQELSLEEAIQQRAPLLFFGFPSAKDPEYGNRMPDRSACVIISVVPTSWFKSWAGATKGHRGEDYQEAKMAIGEQLWEQVLEIFPQLSDRRRYFDTATPVTAEFYLNAVVGESYGLDHNQDRFSPDILLALRPRVPEIKNLYLAGQDILTAGFSSAFSGGIMCSHAILEDTGDCKSLFGNLAELYKKCMPTDA